MVHGLGTPALAFFVLRQFNVPGGIVYVHGRDYTVTIVDDNTLTITLLAPRVPANPLNPAGIATPGADGLLFTVIAFLP